jgi:NADPH:quinone reductase-like Zn-dependent oxidoreductase
MLMIVSIASPIMTSENTKILVRGKGSPLEATITAKPTIIEPNEVMIRLKAIAINPADCKMIDQGHRVTSWPLVPGLDGAGVVEAVGANVKNFALGNEVLAMFTAGDRGGAFQNFAVVQEMMVAKKPTTWSFEDAATLGYFILSFIYLCLSFFIYHASGLFCMNFGLSG